MRVSHIPLPLIRRARHSIALLSLPLLATLALTACINDYEDDDLAMTAAGLRVEMTLSTRSADIENATNGGDSWFEPGTEEENYISQSSVRVYFFTYGSDNDKNGTFVAMLTPSSVTQNVGTDDYSYTVTGVVDKSIAAEEYKSFRVAVCANWTTYPDATDMEDKTIDDLCEYSPSGTEDNWSTYSYQGTSFTPSSTGDHIPYFGIAAITVSSGDDSGSSGGDDDDTSITWVEGATTDLGTIYLLKAMARIEVIYEYGDDEDPADDDSEPIGAVWLRRYNSTGYCAPQGVYSVDDYYTAKTGTQSDSDIWRSNYDQNGVHLVGGSNDTDDTSSDPKYVTFNRVPDGYTSGTNSTACWRAYVPEYSNQEANYSYIQIYWGDEVDESGNVLTTVSGEHQVFFANYTNQGTTAYSEQEEEPTNGYYKDRIDIHRNYLYRFFVTRGQADNDVTVTVYVEPWDTVQADRITVD